MVAYLTAIELRRRWRSVLLLSLLVAVVVGTVLASVAGARSSGSSLDRYLAVPGAALLLTHLAATLSRRTAGRIPAAAVLRTE